MAKDDRRRKVPERGPMEKTGKDSDIRTKESWEPLLGTDPSTA